MITRVLIADDHPIFRRGLEEVIRADDRLELVAEAEDGAQAMRLIRQEKLLGQALIDWIHIC